MPPGSLLPRSSFRLRSAATKSELASSLCRRVRESQDRTATVSYGVLGALLGLALGAAGGLARLSPRAAITAALIGLVLGAAAGAGTTFLVLPWYHAYYIVPGADNFAPGAGPGPGDAWRDLDGYRRRGGAGSRAESGRRASRPRHHRRNPGAALATGIYEFGAAALFPMEKTFLPTAIAPAPRLLADLAVALCVSAGALWAANHLSLRRESVRTDS